MSKTDNIEIFCLLLLPFALFLMVEGTYFIIGMILFALDPALVVLNRLQRKMELDGEEDEKEV